MDLSFIHLHNHSEYSILDGCLKIATWSRRPTRTSMPAVALTDHGNIFGAVTFFKEAKARGIKPILGCEVYVAPGSRLDKGPTNEETHHFHLVLLVKNEKGYRNLCQLLTKAYLEGFYYRPRIDKEILAGHDRGADRPLGLPQGRGQLPPGAGPGRARREGRPRVRRALRPGRFLPRAPGPRPRAAEGDQPEDRRPGPEARPAARRHERRPFPPQEDAETQDVLLCIQTNKKITDQDRIRFSAGPVLFQVRARRWPSSSRTSPRRSRTRPGSPPSAISTSRSTATSCPNFQPPDGTSLSEYFEAGRPRRVPGADGRAQARRSRPTGDATATPLEEYEERLDREIRLIKEMGFEGYFLIVWDLIKAAREKGIPVGPGRGSAAGSMVAYCLGITEIDPIEYDLLFERFLNPERISLPDIDIDFCARRRQEMIEYVTEEIRPGQRQPDHHLRDDGRPGRHPGRRPRPRGPAPRGRPDRQAHPGLRARRDPRAPRSRPSPSSGSSARRTPRSPSSWPSPRSSRARSAMPPSTPPGVVITPKPLVEFVPLYQSVKGEITTQFAMGDIEAIGLLKMDMLGLRNLTVIDDALELIEKDTGERIDIDAIPLDDRATFDLFKAGNTDGVFQFESPGMKDLLRSFKPEVFRDLIALNALYRPGPLKSGMTDEFIHRKNHPERIDLRVPRARAHPPGDAGDHRLPGAGHAHRRPSSPGFSLAEADILRKAMGKKVKDIMKAQKQRFLQGARKNGIAQAKADEDLRPDRPVRRIRLQQIPQRRLRLPRLPDGLPQGPLPAPLHGRPADLRSRARGDAPGRQVHQRVPARWGSTSCRRTSTRATSTSRWRAGTSASGWRPSRTSARRPSARSWPSARSAAASPSPFDLFQDDDARVVNRKALESLIKAGAFDSLGWRRSQCFHLLDKMIEFGHEIQRSRTQQPEPPLRRGRPRAARDPGRGPGDAGVGRVPLPVLRDGRPRLLHHGPSRWPNTRASSTCSSPTTSPTSTRRTSTRRSAWPGSSPRSSRSRRKRTSAWPPSSSRT